MRKVKPQKLLLQNTSWHDHFIAFFLVLSPLELSKHLNIFVIVTSTIWSSLAVKSIFSKMIFVAAVFDFQIKYWFLKYYLIILFITLRNRNST